MYTPSHCQHERTYGLEQGRSGGQGGSGAGYADCGTARCIHYIRAGGCMKSSREALYAKVWSWTVHYVGGLYNRSDTDHLFLIAGGLSYSLMICMVPFVLVIFFVLGMLLDPSDLERQVDFVVTRAVPYPAYAEVVKSILIDRARELVTYRHVYGIAGAAGLLFTTSGLFSSMRTILNTIYRVDEVRSEVIGKLRDFGMVFVVLCLFLSSVVFLPAIEGIQERLSGSGALSALRLDVFQNILVGAGSSLLIVAIFYLLYAFVPYGRMSRAALLVSAIWAMVLWKLAEQAFGWYIGTFASMDRLYGTYAALVVVFVWIYYASLTFIIGAQIGQLYRERRDVATPSMED